MKYLVSILAVLMVFAVAASAADVTGKWKAESQGPNGQTRTSEFDFKADGAKLTGTVAGGRGGAVEISEGKINGDEISFVVVRKFQEREFKANYKGKVSGNEIKFTVTMGERTFETTAKKI
jgi:hypothetical protein